MSSSRGKKVVAPASKKRKRASSSAVPHVPQEELFKILGARPLITSHCIDWATVEQIQLADVIRALLTTDPWELFFGIIEPTYLELTMELCSTFHLQTVMTNYDDPGTVQFCLGDHIHRSPLRCWDALVPSGATYNPSRSKISALPPSLRYLHTILADRIIGSTRQSGIGRGSFPLAPMLLNWLSTSGSSAPRPKNHPLPSLVKSAEAY
ncbi:hypothetical protein GOBAR_AA28876 [Gossypium barbadense]|uniref:Uncharacterized protein n=1 Tax=Gossypium barbadense TaxID=3634 RepID=A0A2P5WL35_GOSBA|nr:hypothetical protein GOBAR_AA28876 [Gossypium barbadense]